MWLMNKLHEDRLKYSFHIVTHRVTQRKLELQEQAQTGQTVCLLLTDDRQTTSTIIQHIMWFHAMKTGDD